MAAAICWGVAVMAPQHETAPLLQGLAAAILQLDAAQVAAADAGPGHIAGLLAVSAAGWAAARASTLCTDMCSAMDELDAINQVAAERFGW